MDESRPVEEVLDAIGDERAREVLAAVATEPRPAKQLADACDMSLPTIYRRLELLERHDLVTERTEVSGDGNHYNVYECNFESTVVKLDDDGEYEVRVYRRANVPDRFEQLWDELAGDRG
ncbi:ArsR/SmtB family transcription factor [Halosegnis sp.]|uniref:ArsR/SmtB family transcription factor n=1 Tax=Halosegnis sp. TaxID=2864959 RepID=UPI0035D4C0A2